MSHQGPRYIDIFWDLVDKSGDCWTWTKGRFRTGYGCVNVGGRMGYTHRVAWEKANGPIPDGLHVLHRCDNRICVRPEHLFLGTNNDNIADMRAKGRHADPPHPSGDAHWMRRQGALPRVGRRWAARAVA